MLKKTLTNDSWDHDAIMEAGRLALLPGYRLLMKRTIAFLESEFDQLMSGVEQPKAKLGRPKRTPEQLAAATEDLERFVDAKGSIQQSAQKAYWAKFTPEERIAENARRAAKGRAKHGKSPQQMAGAAMKNKAKKASMAIEYPDQIDGRYTVTGAAKVLGRSTAHTKRLLQQAEVDTNRIVLNGNARQRINTYAAKGVEQLAEQRGAN